MYTQFQSLSLELLRYINCYERKYGSTLIMKNVTHSVKQRLSKNKPITLSQFQPISKFIIREKKFKTYSHSDLVEYFEPLFQQPNTSSTVTLDSFFQ